MCLLPYARHCSLRHHLSVTESANIIHLSSVCHSVSRYLSPARDSRICQSPPSPSSFILHPSVPYINFSHPPVTVPSESRQMSSCIRVCQSQPRLHVIRRVIHIHRPSAVSNYHHLPIVVPSTVYVSHRRDARGDSRNQSGALTPCPVTSVLPAPPLLLLLSPVCRVPG